MVAPPYFTGLDRASMEKLASGAILSPSGIVVLQQSRKERFNEAYGSLVLKKTYRYGDTRISTYVQGTEG
jgi:16S rRNA G966 N2-methylase RsmD